MAKKLTNMILEADKRAALLFHGKPIPRLKTRIEARSEAARKAARTRNRQKRLRQEEQTRREMENP